MKLHGGASLEGPHAVIKLHLQKAVADHVVEAKRSGTGSDPAASLATLTSELDIRKTVQMAQLV